MKLLSKKGDANMWWIIVGAIVALVAMIVLILIFADTTGKSKQGILDCESKRGSCDYNSDDCRANEGSVSPFDCKEPGKVCCFIDNK